MQSLGFRVYGLGDCHPCGLGLTHATFFAPPPQDNVFSDIVPCDIRAHTHTHTHTHTNTNKPAAQENKARLNMEGWVGGFSVFKELTEVFGGSLVGAEGEFPGLKACLRVPMP